MSIRQLQKAEWSSYFDQFSKQPAGRYAAIEIDSRRLGSQIEIREMLFEGIVYDRKSDLIEIILEGLDHMVYQPRELYIEEQLGEVTSLAVRSVDGTLEILTFHAPLLLPAESRG